MSVKQSFDNVSHNYTCESLVLENINACIEL